MTINCSQYNLNSFCVSHIQVLAFGGIILFILAFVLATVFSSDLRYSLGAFIILGSISLVLCICASRGNVFDRIGGSNVYPTKILFKDGTTAATDGGNCSKTISVYKSQRAANTASYFDRDNDGCLYKLVRVNYDPRSKELSYTPLTKPGRAYLKVAGYLMKHKTSCVIIRHMDVEPYGTSARVVTTQGPEKIACYINNPKQQKSHEKLFKY